MRLTDKTRYAYLTNVYLVGAGFKLAISKGYEAKNGSAQVVGIKELVTGFVRLAKSGSNGASPRFKKRTNKTLKR